MSDNGFDLSMDSSEQGDMSIQSTGRDISLTLTAGTATVTSLSLENGRLSLTISATVDSGILAGLNPPVEETLESPEPVLSPAEEEVDLMSETASATDELMPVPSRALDPTILDEPTEDDAVPEPQEEVRDARYELGLSREDADADNSAEETVDEIMPVPPSALEPTVLDLEETEDEPPLAETAAAESQDELMPLPPQAQEPTVLDMDEEEEADERQHAAEDELPPTDETVADEEESALPMVEEIDSKIIEVTDEDDVDERLVEEVESTVEVLSPEAVAKVQPGTGGQLMESDVLDDNAGGGAAADEESSVVELNSLEDLSGAEGKGVELDLDTDNAALLSRGAVGQLDDDSSIIVNDERHGEPERDIDFAVDLDREQSQEESDDSEQDANEEPMAKKDASDLVEEETPPLNSAGQPAGGPSLIRYTCPDCKTQGMQAIDRVGAVVTCAKCSKAMRLVLKR